MFRRNNEDEIEYTLQPANKNPGNSGNIASNNSSLAAQIAPQLDAQATSVPFIKTSAAQSAPVQPEALKADLAAQTPVFAPAPAPKAEVQAPAPTPAPREVAAKPAPKSQAVNTFVPSALRASNNVAAQPSAPVSTTSNFAVKTPLKIDNIGLETERRLTVGYGISLEGKISDCDKLVIYGTVNAELNNVKALQISDSGCFRGAAEIDFAEISGLFEGELKVRKSIVINATGKVSGKITYGSIEIKPGGKFTGEIVEDKALSDAAAAEAAEKSDAEEQGSSDNSSISSGFNLFADDKAEIAA